MTLKNTLNNINQNWTDIYHLLHCVHQENISHQAIRLLQHIEKKKETTIGDLATYIDVTHNTASEHIKRLIKKGLVTKERSVEDERKVFVILTEEGREVLNRNTRLDDEKLKKVLENLNSSEIEMIEKAFFLLSQGAKECF
ncbi:MarR family winged helix-turn-helix transcriptional regulator [Halalkalibacter akibai]|uniref:HTH-type transcriptional regulator SarZ n=1 Tax=Halalkalibacter akibai (strain ATCC 43226 / DSM 21942 / CIP 109018 / JCM 9157 / 1139) TaxID=1236973 RepID=W4QYG4_HALA3|nr:MarR family transcriptional regulator [Halalkalibacter akibai]GAE37185.1 transcriptional regulator [Halalkalibacter akibai JCM 9157]